MARLPLATIAPIQIGLNELVPRHGGDGRPKIYPEGTDPEPLRKWLEGDRKGPTPGGGEWYTRTTTFIDALDDKSQLSDWHQRMLLEGVARVNPRLLQDYLDIPDPMGKDKSEVMKIVSRAREAAGAGDRAKWGDALHQITEKFDMEGELSIVPPEFEADLDAYCEAVRDLEMLVAEKFVVNDELKYAGTLDRAIRVKGQIARALGVSDGTIVIGDLKTGRSVDFAKGKYGMQLAGYAYGKDYNPLTFERSPLTFDVFSDQPVSQEVGLLIHLPAGEGRCDLIRIDVARGWEDFNLARQTREYRKYWNSSKRRWKPLLSVQA